MAHNPCTPSSIYGGFEHTLFLGLSVTGATASLGWNEQSSTCTISLVEDPCSAPASNPKVYYDGNLARQTTTDPDPGFIGEGGDIIGCPAYFRLGEFEFSGLVQSWTKSFSVSGNPTYKVVLIDPRQILQGCQMIIGEYAGGINKQAVGCIAGGSIAPYNVFNVFGYMEQFGVPCPEYSQGADGPIFGTPAGGFGGSNRNENGMQWSRIKSGFNILANSGTSNAFSPHGRVVYKGAGVTANYGLMGANYGAYSGYIVDISGVGASAPSYYRLNGMSISVMEAISQVCEDSGHDYFVQLLPTGSYNVISVSVVDRGSQPSLSGISDFVAGADGVVQKTYGRESRNETTAAFLTGGPKQSIFQASGDYLDMEGDPGEEDDVILPYFGVDANKDLVVPEKDGDGFWSITVETWEINQHLKILQLPNEVTIDEKEMMFAMGGYDEWSTWCAFAGTDTGDVFNLWQDGILNIKLFIDMVAAGKGPVLPGDGVAMRRWAWMGLLNKTQAKMEEDIRAIHEWVSKFANEYYGRKIAVRVPYVCGWTDSESGKVIMSSQPSDGGWTEETEVILLPDGALLDFFRAEDGKLGAFVRFPNANKGVYELAELEPEDMGIYNGYLYVRASVETEYVYHTYSTRTGPRVVLNLSKPVLESENEVHAKWIRAWAKFFEWGGGMAKADAENKLLEILENLGMKHMFDAVQSRPFLPDAAAVPIASNILCYGPWVGLGPPGQTRVEQNDGLVPWEYGGCATMSAAGAALATEGLTSMTVGEQGQVVVAGYPTSPLGAEIGAYGGGFFGAGTHLYENRTPTSDSFSENDYDGNPVSATISGYAWNWSGVYGPSITGISIDIGTGGLTTTYSFRSYTPKSGRFAKANADRLKTSGKGGYQLGRKLRQWQLQRAHKGRALVRSAFIRNAFKMAKEQNGRIAKMGTPHEVLAGQIVPWQEKNYRTPIQSMPPGEVPTEMEFNYSKKAFMSLDGLVRPISMGGYGGLPRFATSYKSNCQYSNPAGATPPAYDGSCAVGGTGDPVYVGQSVDEYITYKYLNPFSNPTGFDWDDVTTDKVTTHTGGGHDIEVLGRVGTGTGGNTPTQMKLRIEGEHPTNDGIGDYRDDYGAMALRGPLIVVGWGYDTDGKPIPNSADTETDASGGDFTNTSLTCKFLDEFLRKPHTWPMGPVDLRWDRSRRVWVSPPTHRLVRAQLCGDLCGDCGGSGWQWAEITGGPDMYDCDGNTLTGKMIKAYDPIGLCVPSGDCVMAYYDPLECKYYVVNQHTQHHLRWDGCSGVGGNNDWNPYTNLSFGPGLEVTKYLDHDNCTCGDAYEIDLCTGVVETIVNDAIINHIIAFHL